MDKITVNNRQHPLGQHPLGRRFMSLGVKKKKSVYLLLRLR
ncbi:hypothetical protein [Spirosoma daeguense]